MMRSDAKPMVRRSPWAVFRRLIWLAVQILAGALLVLDLLAEVGVDPFAWLGIEEFSSIYPPVRFTWVYLTLPLLKIPACVCAALLGFVGLNVEARKRIAAAVRLPPSSLMAWLSALWVFCFWSVAYVIDDLSEERASFIGLYVLGYLSLLAAAIGAASALRRRT